MCACQIPMSTCRHPGTPDQLASRQSPPLRSHPRTHSIACCPRSASAHCAVAVIVMHVLRDRRAKFACARGGVAHSHVSSRKRRRDVLQDRWSNPPVHAIASMYISYPTGHAGGVRLQDRQDGGLRTRRRFRASVGNLLRGFPAASSPRYSSQPFRRPRRLRLRLRAGFDWDSRTLQLGGRMTGACRLIRRLSSPAQGAISSVLSPPICLRHDLSDGASSVRENEGRGGGNRRHMVKISCIR